MMAELSLVHYAVLSLAQQEARDLASAAIDTEHVFIALCAFDFFCDATRSQVVGLGPSELEQLRGAALDGVARLTSARFDAAGARRRMRRLWTDSHPVRQVFAEKLGPRSREVLRQARKLAAAGASDLGSLWLAILSAPSPLLDEVLQAVDTSRERLRQAFQPMKPGMVVPVVAEQAAPAEPARKKDTIADRYGRDLTRLARDGELARVAGRSDEVKDVARILVQARKSSPVLVGEAGVGKTAIVEGLAAKLVEPGTAVPPSLRDVRIVELSPAALVAGTKYRGDLEERVQQLIKEAGADPSLILFMDEIHTLVGAGASGPMDVSNLLKPALARGEIRCIGATTIDEYRRYIERDPALERRFEVVWVDEPSRDAAIEILDAARAELEAHHGISVSREAVTKAVDLSIRYIPDRRLPDKALDLLDNACSRALLVSFTPASGSGAAGPRHVGPREVAQVVAARCRVPEAELTKEEGERLLRLEPELGERVLGQEEAVRAVADTVRSARLGLRDPRRPSSVFLFLGPTGVGKTELARALAHFIFGAENCVLRFDMSEYSEKHAVAKLIGAPPGYVGHDEGARLVDAVRTRPYSVVLFDEIEKAHPEVFDLFLQIFDEGRLTDSRGRRASFLDTIVILTSNVGARIEPSAPRPAIGFQAAAPAPRDAGAGREAGEREYRAAISAAVGALLRPEIRNRIQKEIVFRPLEPSVVERIIDKILARVNKTLEPRGIKVELGAGAREVLMRRGFDRRFGARAMERAVHELIEEPLGRELLEGRIRHDSRVVARAAGGALVLESV